MPISRRDPAPSRAFTRIHALFPAVHASAEEGLSGDQKAKVRAPAVPGLLRHSCLFSHIYASRISLDCTSSGREDDSQPKGKERRPNGRNLGKTGSPNPGVTVSSSQPVPRYKGASRRLVRSRSSTASPVPAAFVAVGARFRGGS